ncbi:hypothetical protein GW17_00021152, partial [Ensete ventricosum]
TIAKAPLQRGDLLQPRPPTQGVSTTVSPQGRQVPGGTVACSALGRKGSGQATRVGCSRQGHRGNARPRPARRGARPPPAQGQRQRRR